jgi:[acyl-carrier-protein] S-malonyltransferase
VAGHRSAVERAVAVAPAHGVKRSVLLPVSAPFHCRLMAPAAERLAAVLAGVRAEDPRPPVVRNVDAELTTRADDVRPFLVRQVTAPVRWTDCVNRMAREGCRTFVEVGPGKVLTGLLKRIDGALTGVAVEDVAGIDRAAAALRG